MPCCVRLPPPGVHEAGGALERKEVGARPGSRWLREQTARREEELVGWDGGSLPLSWPQFQARDGPWVVGKPHSDSICPPWPVPWGRSRGPVFVTTACACPGGEGDEHLGGPGHSPFLNAHVCPVCFRPAGLGIRTTAAVWALFLLNCMLQLHHGVSLPYIVFSVPSKTEWEECYFPI